MTQNQATALHRKGGGAFVTNFLILTLCFQQLANGLLHALLLNFPRQQTLNRQLLPGHDDVRNVIPERAEAGLDCRPAA